MRTADHLTDSHTTTAPDKPNAQGLHPSWINPDPLWAVPEWSTYVGITPEFCRQLIKQRRLTSVRIGGKVLLRKSTADALITHGTREAIRPLARGRFGA